MNGASTCNPYNAGSLVKAGRVTGWYIVTTAPLLASDCPPP